MPKKRIRAKKNTEEDIDLENLSIISQFSDDSQSTFKSPIKPEDDTQTASSLEKLSTMIDGLYEKRPDVRIASLNSIVKIFRTNYLSIDETWNHSETFLSGIESILKKGKPTDQTLAAECLGVFAAQLSPFEVQTLVPRFKSMLETTLSDISLSCTFRGACANSLSILLFLSNFDDFVCLRLLMKSLETIFRASCLKGDGKPPVHSSPVFVMHCVFLRAWGLIFTILPSSEAYEIGKYILPFLISLLQSTNLEVRLTAGEIVIIIYERIRYEVNANFKGPYFTQLIDLLETLSTDSTKGKSKGDLKKQRHSFRDALHFLRTNELCCEQSIKLGSETLELVSYSQNYYYNIFCLLLSCGVNTHLQENENIRSIYDLGPPLVVSSSTHAQKSKSKASKQFANQFAFKSRTLYMSSSRDKRTTVVSDLDV